MNLDAIRKSGRGFDQHSPSVAKLTMQDGLRVRIESIRLRAVEEREKISQVDAQLVGGLARLLKSAASLVADVEQLFLSATLLKEDRSPAEWRYWLNRADEVLARAVRQRLMVQQMADRFGPDALD